jgi:hypothetical protein
MKKMITITAIILIAMAGCRGGKQLSEELIVVDVTKSYPVKELILQDFMDVEYIALETTDGFITQSSILDIGKEIILVRNNTNDGDIFVYDKSGKGLRKFNHMGQGPEDYGNLAGSYVTLDEENKEILINNFMSRQTTVYDLYGNFVRRFSQSEGVRYATLRNFDREYLIGKATSMSFDETATESQPFAIISKKDGSIVHDIRIHFEKAINTRISSLDGGFVVFLDFSTNLIIPFRDSWILAEFSSDTLYRLLPDFSLTPFIARTPSVHSTDPEIICLPILFTDRYCFLETFKRESEYSKKKLIYDLQENTIHNYTVINDDYSTKKTLEFSTFNSNKTIAFWQKIEAHELIELNQKGELKGALKEIASKLVAEDNPVIMLVKHKQYK